MAAREAVGCDLDRGDGFTDAGRQCDTDERMIEVGGVGQGWSHSRNDDIGPAVDDEGPEPRAQVGADAGPAFVAIRSQQPQKEKKQKCRSPNEVAKVNQLQDLREDPTGECVGPDEGRSIDPNGELTIGDEPAK